MELSFYQKIDLIFHSNLFQLKCQFVLITKLEFLLNLKSAVMLAGLNSFGTTEIIEVKKSRDHTENMLIENSKAIRVKKSKKNS